MRAATAKMAKQIVWLVAALMLLLTAPAGAQSLLPNGQQQFADGNGVPLAGGSVYFYVPGTTTAKFTYQNQGLTVPNTNPVVLNAAGRATIWGSGLYREIVYDANGGLVWDQITSGQTALQGNGVIWAGTSTGTANSQVLSPSPALSGYSAGLVVQFVAGATNTGALTLNVNGLGVKNVRAGNGGLSGNEVISGAVQTVVYDGTQWQLVGPELQKDVRLFGAKCDGSADDTAAIQLAGSFGGTVNFPEGQCNFTHLTFPVPVRLEGSLASDGTSGTILNSTSTDANSKIVLGNGTQIRGGEINNMTINAPASGGGALVFYNSLTDASMTNVSMLQLGSTAQAVKITVSNKLTFTNMRIVNPVTSGFYIYGTDSARTDVITLDDVNVTGDSQTTHTHVPNAVELDGFVNTIVGNNLTFVGVGRGVYSHNSVGASLRQEFIAFDDMEVDFPYYEAVYMNYHDGAYFINPYMQGSITAANVDIEPGSNTTQNIQFIGGNSSGAFKQGMVLNGRNVRVLGVDIYNNSKAGSASYAGVQVGASSVGVTVVGNQIGENTGLAVENQSYGVEVLSGAAKYNIVGNDLNGNVTGALSDAQNSTNTGITSATFPNTGMMAAQSLQLASPANGDTVNMNATNLRLTPSGTIAGATLNLPKADHDGQIAQVWTFHTITTLTVNAAGGQSIDANSAVTTLTANTGFTYKFANATATWERVQ